MGGDQIAIADREVERMKTPQADGSSAPLNATEKPRVPPKKRRGEKLDRGDAHIGATEDQMSDTQAPTGEAYKDEPKQG
jgi:hypothetical protein